MNSGLLVELNDVMQSDAGKPLYNAIPQKLWASVSGNGHTYVIPTTIANDNGVYVAFNNEYIAEEDIDNWDGSIEGLYDIVSQVECDDSTAPRFQYLISEYEFASMINCEISEGLLYDYDTMSIQNPVESEKLIGYLRTLDNMKKAGYMLTTSYIGNDISKNSTKVDDVIEFLGIFYGEEKYGNILLYGQEGTDYQIIDNAVCDMNGDDIDEYTNKLCLKLAVNTYPNNREEYFSFYDDMEVSPFMGFEPDNTNKGTISKDVDRFMNDACKKSVDGAIASASSKLTSDSIDEYLESVKSQWEEYQQ